jgi:hypothetical protein
MENELGIYFCSDQPVTCPHCGNRTDVTTKLSLFQSEVQEHCCLSIDFLFKFLVIDENDPNIDLYL